MLPPDCAPSFAHQNQLFPLCLSLVGLWARLLVATAQDAAPSPQSQQPPDTAESQSKIDNSDAVILELSNNLSLEHRRYLVYLYARLNKPKIAAVLADRILTETPNDKQTLLVLASMHIEQKDVDRALYYGRKLVRVFPDDEQARYYLSAAHYLAGQFAHARDVLNGLKSEQYRGRLFPYQSDLASATFRAADWHRAMIAYQELLRRHNLTDEVRMGARQVLEGIYRLHLPQVSADSTAYLLAPGSYYRTKLDYRQHTTDRNKLFFRWDREDTQIMERPLLRQRSTDRNDVSVGLETMFSQAWTTSLSVGGSESGLIGNAVAVRTFGEQQTLTFEFMGNAPASDGLLFQSLDGRENRLKLSADYRLGRKWKVSAELFGRHSLLGGERLGLGYGGTWNVERTLIRNRPDFRIGYRGIWTRFSSDNQNGNLVAPSAVPGLGEIGRLTLLQSLLLPKFHRQGLYFTWHGQLSEKLLYHLTAGADYALDRSSIEQNAATGFTFYPTRSIELKSEVAFASSASTADQASTLWQINVAFKYWF